MCIPAPSTQEAVGDLALPVGVLSEGDLGAQPRSGWDPPGEKAPRALPSAACAGAELASLEGIRVSTPPLGRLSSLSERPRRHVQNA